ncbi:MAG: response regulator, partial [Thermodesulfobacteriota bacterium]|nr:response regulator [Thermodesulfobacteriota bacterium]
MSETPKGALSQSSINHGRLSVIKVLIVDDSFTSREYMKHIINSDKNLEVVGVAKDGAEAVELVKTKRPDVVTMDIDMPCMNGYEATQKIMQEYPVPIVIVSSRVVSNQVENIFRALQAGAVAVLEKPKGPGHSESDRMVSKIIKTVKLMSEVKVVRHIKNFRKFEAVPKISSEVERRSSHSRIGVVAIGASTGGPPVIKDIVKNLPGSYSIPILIVQHITAGFLTGMVEWLNKETDLSIKIAT